MCRRALLALALLATASANPAPDAPLQRGGHQDVAALMSVTEDQQSTVQSLGLGPTTGAGHSLSFRPILLLGGVFLAAALGAFLLRTGPVAKLRNLGFGFEEVRFQKTVKIAFACAAFMLTGPALMLLNKHIMQELHFPYPLSLSGLGVLVSAVFSRLMVALGLATMRPESIEAIAGSRWFRTALPVGACKAATLATGNAAYLHLGLGFIQMLKAFTPAFVLAVMWSLGAARPSRSAVWFVFIIVAGTVVEVKGELNATVIGLVLMTVSEVVEAINLVLTQQLLQDCKFTVMEGLYALAPPSAVCLFSAAAVLEWPAMVRHGHVDVFRQRPEPFIAAAALGLAVNFCNMLLVQVTSSLFCKILNTVRCICLVFVGVLFYNEEMTFTEFIGYFVALLGFVGYNYVQVFPKEGTRLEVAVDGMCCGTGSFLKVEKSPTGASDDSA